MSTPTAIDSGYCQMLLSYGLNAKYTYMQKSWLLLSWWRYL